MSALYPQFFKKPENPNITSEIPLSLEGSRTRVLDAALWYLMRAQGKTAEASISNVSDSYSSENPSATLTPEFTEALSRSQIDQSDVSGMSNVIDASDRFAGEPYLSDTGEKLSSEADRTHGNIFDLDARRAMAEKARAAANESREAANTAGNTATKTTVLDSRVSNDGIPGFEIHGEAS